MAYVIPSHADSISAGSLKAHASKLLPEYMAPALYVPLQAFPLTPTGKTDLSALPELVMDADTSESGPAESCTSIEAQMREIWVKLLGTEDIGIQDSFFALGGHSLLAIRLISRIEGALNVRIPIQILFDRPTIKTLTEYVVERMIEADEETNSD